MVFKLFLYLIFLSLMFRNVVSMILMFSVEILCFCVFRFGDLEKFRDDFLLLLFFSRFKNY